MYIAGTIVLDGIRFGHTKYEAEVLANFILNVRPRNFVEIGVHEGGLSWCMIPLTASFGCRYFGVEINCSLIQSKVKNTYVRMGATLLCEDCFSEGVKNFIACLPSPKIIYCDGGHKAQEINHFKSVIYPSDVILCHDFYGFGRIPREIPEWEGLNHEVVEADIQMYESDNHFKRLPEDVFKETRILGWSCVE